MTAHKYFGLALLAASSPLALVATSAEAQTRTQTPATTQGRAQSDADSPLTDEEPIVVTGQRERGAVVGDVKPEQQLNAGDIRALGVSNVNELIQELGPQLQSASGKPPVMLLEGHRMSSPLEIASLPSEAIARVDVLPEEVGLRYGYDADQKVINIVLRERFRAVTGQLDGRIPTAGGGNSGTGELTFLAIRNGKRFNLGVELKDQASLFETERGLTSPDSPYRTLTAADRQLTINSTYHLSLADRIAATLNGQLVTDGNDSSIGRDHASTLDPYFASGPQNVRPLERTTSRQTAHLGFNVAKDHAKGQLTLTGNYDHAFSRSLADRPFILGTYADAVEAGDPSAATVTPGTFLIGPDADVARTYTDTGTLDLLYSTAVVTLPAGDIAMTGHLTGSTSSFRANRLRGITETPSRINRSSGGGSVNLNIPVIGTSMPIYDTIGRLSLNLDASLNELSDAGTIHSFSGGFNWQPKKFLSFTGNYTVRQTAPTAQQLGDAAVPTSNVPIFDYRRGETVNVTTISGGNPNLDKAEVHSFRIGMSVQPLKDPQLNFQVDLSQNRNTGGISSLPGVSLVTEGAFPSRFTRDAPTQDDIDNNRPGVLRSVDLRPINIGEQKTTQLRWGFNFTMQLKTPQSEIRAFQETIRKRIQERIASGQLPPDVAARMTQALQNGQLGQAGQRGAANGQQGGQAQAGAAGATPQATPQQGGAAGQPAANGQQQGANGQPVIVVQGNPDAAPGVPPPGGGNFQFNGPPPGGFGGPGGPGGGGFRGPPGGFGGGGFGGFGGGGGGQGGAPRGGRLNFSVYHTWVLDSTTQLAPGLPVIDRLEGGTLGGGAGPSRHQLQIQAGYTQSFFGFRLFSNWSSATRSIGSSTSSSSDLRFGALSTTNFRIFINFQQMPKLVDKVPFLRGSRLQFGVNNVLDARQKVTNAAGVTPTAYSGAYLDPIGRSVSISFRKLFF